jgi:tRNA (guanine-N7-)-methyltransferase
MPPVHRPTPPPGAPFNYDSRPASGRASRTFKPRKGRLKDTHREAIETLLPIIAIEPKPEILDLQATFGRNAPLCVEIGFGMGESTVAIAQAHRDWNVLGIEVYPNGHGAVALAAKERELTNIRLVLADALDVLTYMLLPHSIHLLTTFFPDPWPKPGQRHRRLIIDSFTELVASRLTEEGEWWMATDWEDYGEQMLAVINNSAHVRNLAADDGFAERFTLRPLTKFERRGIREGRPIVDLGATRRVVENTEHSEH